MSIDPGWRPWQPAVTTTGQPIRIRHNHTTGDHQIDTTATIDAPACDHRWFYPWTEIRTVAGIRRRGTWCHHCRTWRINVDQTADAVRNDQATGLAELELAEQQDPWARAVSAR